jgi:glutamate racemase
LIHEFAYGVTVITQVCPGLVPLVEGGIVDGPEMDGLLRQYLAPLLAADVDVIVLGCTHYPFLRASIQRVCGPGVALIDPSDAVARQLGRVLAARGLEVEGGGGGETAYYTTGDAEAFAALIARLGEACRGQIHHADIPGTQCVGE